MRWVKRMRAWVVTCSLLSTPVAASAASNSAVWAQMPEAGSVDHGDALAHSHGFLLSLGLRPGFDVRRDAQYDYARISGFLSGAYHLVHEGPISAYAGRVDALWVSAAADTDSTTADRTGSVDLEVAASTVELEYRHYLPAANVLGMPLFTAGWGGVYDPSVARRSRELWPDDGGIDPSYTKVRRGSPGL